MCPPRLKQPEQTPVAEGGSMGEKLPRILPKVAPSTSLLGSFTFSKFTTWDRRLYFPSEGRRAEDFFARKIWRLRPGLNPRTWVLKASTLTSRPPKPLMCFYCLCKWWGTRSLTDSWRCVCNFTGCFVHLVFDSMRICALGETSVTRHEISQELEYPASFFNQEYVVGWLIEWL